MAKASVEIKSDGPQLLVINELIDIPCVHGVMTSNAAPVYELTFGPDTPENRAAIAKATAHQESEIEWADA